VRIVWCLKCDYELLFEKWLGNVDLRYDDEMIIELWK
jgi:hypothetical protein